ncbi:cordon-bleu protein-like 1b isoform X1 [Corythoichthys intestinalis]|uniref:cordon-bleu protein-like 1b isoform X1 n=2 Tax=Corythoichthys intestinalis TaxID=161448 RepID=UPI0025A57088|nr:cordon-bleu protein-like 1b isoform X1 [Corythoichthys intestinalis]
MDVERRHEKHLHSCPVNLVRPMSLVMDDHLSQPHPHNSSKRVSTKSKAPSPPELKNLDSLDFSQWYPGNAAVTMDHKEKPVDKDLSLVVVLPDGVEKMTTVHGSKPVMDLLVTLCGRYRLNPSSYTLELITAGRHNIKLKPSALIGTLDVEKILLKPKGDDKNKKTGPQKPEATVRMVINYKKTQKAILRVNPQVALTELLPAICEKCEFALETTILLRDVQSLAPLDLSCSLNDYAIREVYARDTRGLSESTVCTASPTHTAAVTPGKDKNQKEKENKGLFSKFRKSRKTSEQATTASAPASPVLVSKPRPLSMALPNSCSHPLMSPTSPVGDVPKKRRAPQPPILVSQSCHADLSTRQRLYSEPAIPVDCEISGFSRGSSAESSLRRTKRKAPPPPMSPVGAGPETVPPQENLQDPVGVKTLEEITEETSAAAKEVHQQDSDKGSGEDQSRDLSSDGNQPQSTTDDSAFQIDERIPTDPSQAAESVSQVESEPSQSICDEPVHESIKFDRGDVTSDLQLVAEDSQVASVEENAPAPQEQLVSSQRSEIIGTSCPAGEDAQVQTDLTASPEPLPEHQEQTEQVVPSPLESGLESANNVKKDIATATDEPLSVDFKSSQTLDTPPCQTSTPIVAPKVASSSTSQPEPKPKPSNELTRDYIPKIGMTTYTIVPPKSSEKLRYFEVALTLETPPVAAEDTPREEILSTTNTTTTTAANTVNGCQAEATHASSPSSSTKAADRFFSSQAVAPGEVKETKIPPAIRPKPGSFRLSKHKKTPGYYVTSAAEKSPVANTPSGHKVDQVDREMLPPPPPTPPMQGNIEATEVSPSPKKDYIQDTRMTRQSSKTAKEPSFGLSLEKLRSFAAPRPYSPSTPSRFAQAVSSAVKRSRSLPHSPKSPSSPVTPCSPSANRFSAIEQNTVLKFKVNENVEVANGKSSPPDDKEQPVVPSELVQMDGRRESTI